MLQLDRGGAMRYLADELEIRGLQLGISRCRHPCFWPAAAPAACDSRLPPRPRTLEPFFSPMTAEPFEPELLSEPMVRVLLD